MASKSSFPSSARGVPGGGGGEPVIAKGPFFLFLLMMPAFILVIAILLVAMQYKQLRAFVSDRPMQIAKVPESPQAQEEIRAQVRGFFADTSRDTLALTAGEINHLTRSSRLLSDQHLDYHFDAQDTLLVARNSLPATSLRGALSTLARVLGIKGYLNSEMKGYPELKDGKITLVPVSAVMNGVPAPVSVLNQKGPLDVREWVSDKDFYDHALAELAEVKVRGGRLELIKKKRAS
ncbi:MAG TPA: hypothetical protein VJ385_19660 [Fibrobacteria bacterium]|nr:hypothetical protein [Fibrobacteria bacterium]